MPDSRVRRWMPAYGPNGSCCYETENGDYVLARDYDDLAAASPDERLREAGELERFLSTIHFVMPNLNDTFSFATADTEKISVGDGELLAGFWRKHGWRGLVAIAAVQRKAQPLAEVAATPEFQAAYTELLARESWPDEDGEPWTLADEFEIDGQAEFLAAADREAPDVGGPPFVPSSSDREAPDEGLSSVRGATFYHAVCLGCGESPDEDGAEWRATPHEAAEVATEHGWRDGRCEECQPAIDEPKETTT